MTRIRTTLCFLFLLSLLASSARADVIFFNQLAVHDCKEFGACDWGIRYKLGHTAQDWRYTSADGYSLFEADTGDTAIIHSMSLPLESYPVSLFLEIVEVHGNFVGGSDFEHVGAAEVLVDGPGRYELTFNNDEGHVTFYFDAMADSTSDPTPLPQPEPEPIVQVLRLQERFIGVFEAGTDGGIVDANPDGTGRTWKQFVNTWEDRSAKGQRLIDIEGYNTTEGRRYYGVYGTGTDGYGLLSNVNWFTLYNQWHKWSEVGLDLIDVDMYGPKNAARYDAIFRGGGSPRKFAQGTWESFTQAWETLTSQGWRLVDVGIRYVDGVRQYYGTFHEGTSPYGFIVLPWDAFESQWKEATKRGVQLVDVETFYEAGTIFYAGVYKGYVNGQALVASQTWEGFVEKFIEYSQSGYRLIGIEKYTTTERAAVLLRAKKDISSASDVGQVSGDLPELSTSGPSSVSDVPPVGDLPPAQGACGSLPVHRQRSGDRLHPRRRQRRRRH